MEIYTKRKKDTPFFSFSFRRGKECVAFRCSNIFFDIESTATGWYTFFKFPHCPQRLIAGVT